MTTEENQPTGKQVSITPNQKPGYDRASITRYDLIPNMAKNSQGIPQGDYVVGTKGEYADPLEKSGKYGPYYIASFLYEGQEVVMFLSHKDEADSFAQAGGIDDSFKMYWINVPYTYQGEEKFKQRIRFAPLRGE